MREAEGGVEDAEILADRRRAERVDDRDRPALALVAEVVKDRVVVRVRHRGRVEAPPAHGVACRLAWRRRAGADEDPFANERVRTAARGGHALPGPRPHCGGARYAPE